MHRRSRLNLTLQCLESRHLLSSVSFIARQISTSPAAPIAADFIRAADVDADGDADVVLGHRVDGNYLLNLYISNESGFAPPSTIVDAAGVLAIELADLDGDHDQDVVTVERGNDGTQLVAYSNDSGTFNRVPLVGIEVELPQLAAIDTGDLSSNGLPDVALFISDLAGDGPGRLVTFEQTPDGFDEPQTIAVSPELAGLVRLMDVDGDEDQDLVASVFSFPSTGGLIWYENRDGTLSDTAATWLRDSDATLLPTDLAFEDYDGNGNRDLMVLSDTFLQPNRLLLFTSIEDTFAAPVTIGDVDPPPQRFDLADFDLDGTLDVIIQDVSGQLSLIENERQESIQIDSGVNTFATADLDGDGDPDVVAQSAQGLYWYENRLKGDINDDGMIDFHDFLAISRSFGQTGDDLDGDLDRDGQVSFSDFLLFSAQFGSHRPVSPVQGLSTS